ncbi:MAG TPA: phosphopantetheine-binding protein [Acidimicrobiales bacterium]|nr:phosphopantetheine-binding protein [Acidimicrobiales bacterium]
MTGPTMEMEPQVRSVVAIHLDVDPARLQPDARLGEDLCVDSLAAVELAMVLEDEFDIALPEEVLGCVRTYGDVVTLVQQRVEKRSQTA